MLNWGLEVLLNTVCSSSQASLKEKLAIGWQNRVVDPLLVSLHPNSSITIKVMS